MLTTHRVYGWRNSRPSLFSPKFKPRAKVAANLPASFDLRSKYPTPYDQLDLGSCTGNSIAGAVQYKRREAKKPDWTPSRLGIYYGERAMEGTIGQDAGAAIHDGLKVVGTQGTAPETMWPYNTAKFTVKPPQSYYVEAVKHKVLQYAQVENTDLVACKSAIFEHGCLVLGFTVYESFESNAVAKTGIVPMPKSSEQVLGGHAVCAVGYDDQHQWFIVRNSWGISWGAAGYMYFPFAYMTNADLVDDCWTIMSIQ